MIEVRMMPLLAKRARSRQERFAFPFQPGCTPASILSAEGFSPLDQEAITVLVNNVQADLDTPLNDGDRLELLVGIQGGSVTTIAPFMCFHIHSEAPQHGSP